VTIRKLEWEPSLSMGVDTLDLQHRELIDRINDLRTAVSQGQARTETGRMIEFLDEYVKVHFTMEETLMKRKKYRDYVSHRQEHLNFLTMFLEMKKQYEALAAEGAVLSFLAVELDRKLGAWLIEHIAKVDRQFGDFLSQPRLLTEGLEGPKDS
jgi:hemerythrin